MENRIQAHARLLVEDCIDVQPGWQVLVAASALARPLAEEVMRQVAARRAYAIPRISFSGVSAVVELPWLQEAPLELLAELAPVERHLLEQFEDFLYGACLLAIGKDFPKLGGTNDSAVHYDIVKDLRQGGELYADAALVQRSGKWLA